MKIETYTVVGQLMLAVVFSFAHPSGDLLNPDGSSKVVEGVVGAVNGTLFAL